MEDLGHVGRRVCQNAGETRRKLKIENFVKIGDNEECL